MSVYETQAFVVSDAVPVIAKRVSEKHMKTPTQWRPTMTLFFGGTETDDGAAGQPACSIDLYGVESLMGLKQAVDWALLPYITAKLEGT